LLVAKRELEYYDDYIYQPVEKEIKRTPKTSKKTQKKKNLKVMYKMALLGLAIVGLALSLLVLYRYANITKMKFEITQIQEQKAQLQKEKEDLMAELEAIKSYSNIEEEAAVKLGMGYPTEDQIVYISVSESPLGEEAHNQSAENYNIFSQIKNIVNLVLGFF